jgi:hypothetical protein
MDRVVLNGLFYAPLLGLCVKCAESESAFQGGVDWGFALEHLIKIFRDPSYPTSSGSRKLCYIIGYLIGPEKNVIPGPLFKEVIRTIASSMKQDNETLRFYMLPAEHRHVFDTYGVSKSPLMDGCVTGNYISADFNSVALAVLCLLYAKVNPLLVNYVNIRIMCNKSCLTRTWEEDNKYAFSLSVLYGILSAVIGEKAATLRRGSSEYQLITSRLCELFAFFSGLVLSPDLHFVDKTRLMTKQELMSASFFYGNLLQRRTCFSSTRAHFIKFVNDTRFLNSLMEGELPPYPEHLLSLHKCLHVETAYRLIDIYKQFRLPFPSTLVVRESDEVFESEFNDEAKKTERQSAYDVFMKYSIENAVFSACASYFQSLDA